MKKQQGMLVLTIIILFISCSKPNEYDLAIRNVDVFDSEKGEVLKNKTVIISSDTIVSIIPADQKVLAKNEIEGEGKLVTPGFIDTHIHLTSLYGDYDQAPEFLPEDSLQVYRDKLAQTYLNFGVTTIKVAGQPEKWIEPTLEWQCNPTPDYPDIYISGGALISDEKRESYIGHVEVESPEAVQNKIQAYHDMGIRHLKVYWRLRYPELKAALEKAKELDMNVAGHIAQNITFIDSTLNMGLKHYEHAPIIAMDVFRYDQHFGDLMVGFDQYFKNQDNARFFAFIMEIFHFIDNDPVLAHQLDQLIDKMAAEDVTLSTSIHIFAEKFGLTFFTIPPLSPEEDASSYTQEQIDRGQNNFNIMMAFVKKAHDRGVKVVLGTDSREGGKAALSEMLLLKEAGFSTADILQIATINGAKAIGLEEKYGSVEAGQKANLVIFSKSPFDDYKNFLAEKLIIKDGIIYNP
jgi:hypothetical protein